jgi:DNA polymerase III sliding clamp (beta) subunit (PCNA family)
VTVATLKRWLSFAIMGNEGYAQDDTLQGITFRTDLNGVIVFGANRHTLACAQTTLSGLNARIMTSTAQAILAFLPEDETAKISIGANANQMRLETESLEWFVAQLMEGMYTSPFNQFLPPKDAKKFVLPREATRKALDACNTVDSQCELAITKKKTLVSAGAQDKGITKSVELEVPNKIDAVLRVNPAYFSRFMEFAQGDTVECHLFQDDRVICIKQPGEFMTIMLINKQ